MARNVYLVGSVPMADTRQVFASVSAALGARIKRLPDGETGERGTAERIGLHGETKSDQVDRCRIAAD